MWPHCGHGMVAAAPPAAGAAAEGAGTAERCGAADGETATVPASGDGAGAAAAGLGMAEGTAAMGAVAGAAAAAFTPCGGVCGEKGFGAASRGSSAPQPRQNL
jgi:hypothetical protein